MKYVKYLFGVFVILGAFLIFLPDKELKAQTENDVYNITMYLEDEYNYNETTQGYYNELHQAVTFNGYNELVGLFINGQSLMNTYEIIAYEYYNADAFEYEIHYDIRSTVSLTMLTISPRGYYSNNFGNVTLDITLYKPTQYNQGYNTAKEEYGIYYNNQWLTAEEYATIIENNLNVQDYFDNGYNEAKNEFGYNDNGTIIPGQSAYDKGHFDATQDSGELKAQIINFVPGVLGSIFMFFFQIGQIGILGITILDILGILVLISGLIFLIKFFF